jgi:glycosyltransferase involved in cell wall biosynthesis
MTLDVEALLRAPEPTGTVTDAPEPTLSVLMPAYNAADTIADALDSLLSQTVRPHEIIVSDDGSTDETASIVAGYGADVQMIHDRNGGLAVARNRAARIATGTHVALLDADDVWLPERTATLSAAISHRPDLDIMTTDAYVVRGGVRDVDTYYGVRAFPAQDQVDAIMRSNFIFAAAIRRTAFESVGGYDERLRCAEDWNLWIRMLLAGARAGLVDMPLYEYRRRPDSLTGRRVEMGLGVVEMLTRAASLPVSPSQRDALLDATAEWRVDVARRAVDGRASGRGRLVVRALIERRAPAAERGRVAARAIRSIWR